MKKKIMSLLCAATMLIPVIPAAMAQTGIYGWTPNISGADTSYSLNQEFFCDGEQSVQLKAGASGSKASIQTNVSLEQGKSYRVSFWVKAVKANTLTFAIGNHKRSLVSLMKNYDWTEFSFIYQHMEKEPNTAVVFELLNGGEAYIDSVVISPVDKKTNLLANPGFELTGSTQAAEESGLQEYTFAPLEGFLQSYQNQSSVPLLYLENPVLDADASEWTNQAGIMMPATGQDVSTLVDYTGETDLSAQFRFGYDEENLYVWGVVTDDTHYQPNTGSGYWRGDSVQMVLATAEEDYGIEIGFYVTDAGASERYSVELEKTEWGAVSEEVLSLRERTKFSGKRVDNKTYYEMVIPWDIKYPERPQNFLLDILVNDNDGSARGYIEWTPGIGKTKSNEFFPMLFPIEKGKEIFGYSDGVKSLMEYSEEKYYLYLYNTSDKEETVQVSADQQEAVEVVLPAQSVYLMPIQIRVEGGSERPIPLTMTYAGGSFETVRNVPVKKNLLVAFPEFGETQVQELKQLAAQCHEKNLTTDYEDISILTLEDFVSHGLEDYNGGRESRAEYVYDAMVGLYEETKAALESYLSGEKEPFEAVYYNGGDIEIKNQIFYADVINSKTGEVKKSPMFLSGYDAGGQMADVVSDYGANIIQFELPMRQYVMLPGGIRGWSCGIQSNAKVTWSYDEENSKSGSRSIKITNATARAANTYGNLIQNVPLKGGKKYTLSFWAKAEAASGCSYRPLGWKSGKIDISGTYDWQKFSYDFELAEDTTVELMFVSEDITSALYLDNVRIVEKGTKNNLVQQGSFEETPYIIGDFAVNVDKVRNDIIPLFDHAQRNNVVIDLLLSVHYFPTNLLPEEDWKSNQTGFIGFNLYNENVSKVIESFFRGVVPEVMNHPALNSICISNEPTYRAGLDQSNAPAWHAYLEELYTTVDAMNATWKESYPDFASVPMQGYYENPAMYYDYLQFNDKLFADWHRWVADMIHELAPDVRIHTKVMSNISSTESTGTNSALLRGTNPELFMELSDLGGNDSWNFIGQGQSTPTWKLIWYDLLHSVKNVPVFNSEDHVIEDRDERYSNRYAGHIATDIWQGALHGRSATTIWKWGRTLSTTQTTSGNIQHRPDALALAGHTMLDLNRLAPEMEALQNADREIGIFYSYPSRIQSKTHMNGVYRVYEMAGQLGKRTKLITEKMIANGALHDLKVLVVPGVGYTTPEAIEAIKAFAQQGKKVILIGDCFVGDVHTNPLANVDSIAEIKRLSTVYSATTDETTGLQLVMDTAVSDGLKNVFDSLNPDVYTLIDESTNEPVKEVEWCYTEYNGKMLLNLCLYDWDATRTISIRKNGVPVSGAVELRSGEQLSETFVVNCFEPMLIQF